MKKNTHHLLTLDTMNLKRQLNLYFILLLLSSNYCRGVSKTPISVDNDYIDMLRIDIKNDTLNSLLLENSNNKVDTLNYNNLYPNVFEYKYNKITLDTCIYDFAMINLSNKKIIKYIPPYLGVLCLEQVNTEKISAKLRTGFNFKDEGFDIHIFNIHKMNQKIYIEYINKIDTFKIKDYFISDINNIEKQQDILNFLVEKYFYKSFSNKKYIDSLESLHQLYEDYLDVSYINARSTLFHIDTTNYENLPSHYYNNILYKKKELLKTYNLSVSGLD